MTGGWEGRIGHWGHSGQRPGATPRSVDLAAVVNSRDNKASSTERGRVAAPVRHIARMDGEQSPEDIGECVA